MFGLGIGEIAVILFVALIFIGPKKLPELAKGLGKGIREFQNAANGLKHTIQNPQTPPEQSQPIDQPVDQPPVQSEFDRDSGKDCSDEKFVAITGEESSEKKES
jgi:TatA/E family protein of Tat protein translocase